MIFKNDKANAFVIIVAMVSLVVIALAYAIFGELMIEFDDLAVASDWYAAGGEATDTWDFLTETIWAKWPIVAVFAVLTWTFARSIRRRDETTFV